MAIFIDLPKWTYELINGPLIFLNLVFNIFFAFCLIFPPHSGQRKQPLTTLLGFLILCTVVYCIVIILARLDLNSDLHYIIVIFVQYNVDYSMASYVWLNFYYYLQIVPSQCVPIQWAKRNLTCTMYFILVIDGFITFSARAPFMTFKDVVQFNFTFSCDHQASAAFSYASFYIISGHFLLNLAVMVVSSWSTVCYLHRHIKSVTKSGNSFSTAKLQGQLRVTITSICQGVIFFLYTTYHFFHGFSEIYSTDFRISPWIILTIITLFMTCTTVTLGVGQSMFRQRIVNIFNWIICGQCCKRQTI